jgi:pts system N-acetylglucosamine-specific eiicba component
MKDKASSKLETMGKASIFPISLLPLAGLCLGLGTLFTNALNIKIYGLQNILGKVYFVGDTLTVTKTTALYEFLIILSKLGNIIFSNLPLLFAIGTAFAFAKYEKPTAALMGGVFFLIMHQTINGLLSTTIIPGVPLVADTPENPYAMLMAGQSVILGIQSLQMGIFGGIVAGLMTAGIHSRYCKMKLYSNMNSLSVAEFFKLSKLPALLTVICAIFTGVVSYIVWPLVQTGVANLGFFIKNTGYVGTFLFGVIERILMPFGLQNVFSLPLMYTKTGGEMIARGTSIQGFQNMFLHHLTDPATKRFSVNYTRFMTGKYLFMMFGLPAASLAMYNAASKDRKKFIAGLLFSVALASFLVGFTEPLELLLLFTAPLLYLIHIILAGLSFVTMHIMNAATGVSFSGGLADYYLFGVLQGQAKTGFTAIIPLGIAYFIIYYLLFRILISKFNLKTLGRENIVQYDKEIKVEEIIPAVDTVTVRKLTEEEIKADSSLTVENKDNENATDESNKTSEENSEKPEEEISEEKNIRELEKTEAILFALGGKRNIINIDNCSSRLKLEVKNSLFVNDAALKITGALGVIKNKENVEVIYGPATADIKTRLEEYLKTDNNA